MENVQQMPKMSITRYHGKLNRKGTELANDTVIVGGLAGSVSIAVYPGDAPPESGYVRIRVTAKDAAALAALLNEEVARQEAFAA